MFQTSTHIRRAHGIFFLFVDFTHPLHCLSQIFSFALCESLLLQMFKDKRVAEIMSFKDTRWILPEEQKKKVLTPQLWKLQL